MAVNKAKLRHQNQRFQVKRAKNKPKNWRISMRQ